MPYIRRIVYIYLIGMVDYLLYKTQELNALMGKMYLPGRGFAKSIQ